MQAVAQYGRLVARALVAGIHNEFSLKSGSSKQPLHLVTASSGFSKNVAKSSSLSKWTFGDDAYFVARSKSADVIGKSITTILTYFISLSHSFDFSFVFVFIDIGLHKVVT